MVSVKGCGYGSKFVVNGVKGDADPLALGFGTVRNHEIACIVFESTDGDCCR